MIPKRLFIHSGNKFYHIPHEVSDIIKIVGETHGEPLPCNEPSVVTASQLQGAVPFFLPLTNVINDTGVLNLFLSFTSYSTPTVQGLYFEVLSTLSKHLFQQSGRKLSY